ncbi:MAG: DUF1007 family protein [Devosia sp.]|nr:DUF1007 family protein [Devosia sp.]
MKRTCSSLVAAFAVTLVLAGSVAAHPHIFIDARATLVFNEQGELARIENQWTFDEVFSVWQVQGLDTDGDGITTSEEMQELADENLVGLAEYGFYTSVGNGTSSLPMTATGAARFAFQNDRSTLTFGVAPQQPFRIDSPLEIAVADPEYYVAITFPNVSDVRLENAPAACRMHLEPPHEMSADLRVRLYELPPDVTRLPPDLEAALRGTQGAIVVDCSGAPARAEAQTAAEAVAQVAEARPALPFGGPPPEPGFTLPRTGLLGWVSQAQSDFYQALTEALGRLKSDWNAFWVLGGLSFLYGIFHAAGPGHGKVVIGSYMLANERTVRRGILLSFAAALTQSAVAVVFVGVAAAMLGLSSLAMGTAVGWIEKASYALVALLGLWLLSRRLLGWGHHHEHGAVLRDGHGRAAGDPHFGHDHGPGDHHHEDHHHDRGDGHHHVVTAEQTGGNWREQLGVVLGVGMRPCSGALVVLVFALSQGILAAGIAAVFLMGLGTAITVSALSVIAVSAKGLSMRILGNRSRLGGRLVWGVELIGALIVFLFGAVLLAASF